MRYFRPIPQTDAAAPPGAHRIGGSWAWFDHVEILERGAEPVIAPVDAVPEEWLAALNAPRQPILGFDWQRPVVMGILNVTPDSFSDGGQHAALDDAVAHAQGMAAAGADLLDVGGESTRPGAAFVAAEAEIARTAPVISAVVAAGVQAPISIDTRKAPVAEAALAAGARLINDVSGFTFDQNLAQLAAKAQAPVCVMHALGDPATMQDDPRYDDVLLDVYDFLAGRIAALETQGIARSRIIADPGIGFGKTLAHNLTLLRRISLFHGLGVPILLGASRKRFIGTLGGVAKADARVSGSVAVAQMALGQGVQIVRVHDVAETAQAIALWGALVSGAAYE